MNTRVHSPEHSHGGPEAYLCIDNCHEYKIKPSLSANDNMNLHTQKNSLAFMISVSTLRKFDSLKTQPKIILICCILLQEPFKGSSLKQQQIISEYEERAFLVGKLSHPLNQFSPSF